MPVVYVICVPTLILHRHHFISSLVGESKPTIVVLRLVDTSIARSGWVVKDVLVQLELVIFLMDFVVLNVDPDIDIWRSHLFYGLLSLPWGEH